MAKRIQVEDKFYRLRRGKLVEIPNDWLNKIPTKRTINSRPSKGTNKLARASKWRSTRRGDTGPQYIEYIDSRLYDARLDTEFLT